MATTMSFYVDAPVEAVFGFVLDPTRQTSDMGPFKGMKVHEMKRTKEGVGSYYSWSVKMFGIPMQGFEVVTDLEPDRRMTEKSSNSMVGTWEYAFEPEGSGTKVTMTHRQRGIWALPPLSLAMDYVMPRMSKPFIELVKSELEAKPTVPQQRKPASTKSRKKAVSR